MINNEDAVLFLLVGGIVLLAIGIAVICSFVGMSILQAAIVSVTLALGFSFLALIAGG